MRLGRADAAVRFLLECVEDIDRAPDARCVNRAVSVTIEIFHQLNNGNLETL